MYCMGQRTHITYSDDDGGGNYYVLEQQVSIILNPFFHPMQQ